MSKAEAVIYVVEDDQNIRDLVVYTLESTGFDAQGFANGTAFIEAVHQHIPDLVLLDVMLPGTDGVALLKRLRSFAGTCNVPVIMVTAKDAEYDKVAALDSGADDYVTKPFGMMELVSRIRAVLRRSAPATVYGADVLAVGEIELNSAQHTARVSGQPVDLTLKEFELLEELMHNENILLSRTALLDSVWGYPYRGATRTVDVHIRSLRKKIGEINEHVAGYIQTVRGVGYKISAR